MTEVKIPKKLRGFLCTKCGSHECEARFEEEQYPPCNKCSYLGFGQDIDYTEAQLKQYGDDRAREALEMAAVAAWSFHMNRSKRAGLSPTAYEAWSPVSAIRELAKEIK